jgi:putative endonuclease
MTLRPINPQYAVYIMSSRSGRIYVGMTGNLGGRVRQHKLGLVPGHTKKYKLKDLVYFESYQYVNDAIAREKQLKGWLREKKIALVRGMNPGWVDLAADWLDANGNWL